MDQNTQAGRVTITDSMIESMRSTKPWTRLIAVLGFIMVGLMVLVGAGFILATAFFPQRPPHAPLAVMGVMYILFAVLYFMPSLYLNRYSSAIVRFLEGNGTGDLEAALLHQRSFWKFVGILALISIVLSLLAVGAAVLIPLLLKLRTQSGV